MRYENDSGEINFSNSKTDEELKMLYIYINFF